MAELRCQFNINSTPQDIWAVLANFDGFLEWATGGVGSIEIEGTGIGRIRHLNIPGLGEISERLITLDEEDKILEYELVHPGPSGMREYSAKIQVVPDASSKTVLKWYGVFEPMEGAHPDSIEMELKTAYETMSINLEQYTSVNGQSS